MEFVTIVYLVLMFVAMYMFFFFIILNIKNRKELFSYPEPKKIYSITVLVPAYNEEKSIRETIEHVMELNYHEDKLEIIAINDGSQDKTGKIIEKLTKKYKNLKLLDKKNSGKADSLNQGIKMANGELVAVVDADSFPSKDSLRKLTGYFNDKKMGAVTSFVTIRNKDDNFFARLQSVEYMFLGWGRKLLDFVDSVFVTNGPLSLYRKSYVLKVGGFDTNTVTEDIEITWNLLSNGYKTAMCLDAGVSTITPHKIKKWYRQRVRWGVGGLQAIAKYKKMFFRKGVFGAFILPFVSLSIIVSVFTFAFAAYLIAKSLFARFLTISYSVVAETTFFHFQDVNLYPSVMIFYSLVLFLCSLVYFNYVLFKAKYEEKLNIQRFFKLVFYMLIYLMIYPIIWIPSCYRFFKKDYRW